MRAVLRRAAQRAAALHPTSRAIMASGLRVAALAIAAKLFTLLREVMLAYRYGTGIQIDAFNMAFTVTSWLPVLLASTLATGLVPLLVTDARHPEEHRRTNAELNAAVALMALALCGLTIAAAPWASVVMTGDTVPAVTRLTRSMIAQMAPAAGLGLIVGYLAARLQAQQRYLYTIADAFAPIGVAMAALLPVGWPAGQTLTAGLLAGTAAQLLFLMWLLARGEHGLGGFSLRFQSSRWPHVRRSVGSLIAGAAILWITVPVEQAYAARLGAGAVASLNYAARLIGMGTGIATVIIARALLPSFSRAIADGETERSRLQAMRWALICGGIGVLASAVSWPLAGPGIRLLLQRGAFGAHDAAVVETLVRIGMLQLPFFFAGTAAVQWLAASGRYRLLSFIAVLTVATKIALLQALIPSFGLYALMISTVGMYAVALGAQLLGLKTARV